MYDRAAVMERLKPSAEERARVLKAADALLAEAGRIARGRCDPMLVGSVAKDTFLRDPDIDVFLLFPEATTRQELERVGLEIGRAILGGETRYAEHPYTHGEYRGFESDIVPCYRIADASRLRSNVDRTPLHTAFVRTNLPAGLRDDVLLMKAFHKGIGTYGAEIKVEGFSGYLCELLVMRHRGFEAALEASSGWGSGHIHIVDPPGGEPAWLEALCTGDNRFLRPLNVVDPVDPARNVSSAVSSTALHVFMLAAREFLASPDERFFFPHPRPPVTAADARAWFASRGTVPVVVLLERPDLIDDVLYSQVKKAHAALGSALSGAGFTVLSSDFLVSEGIEMAFEVHPGALSSVMLRRGPPVSDANAARFREKWPDAFVDGDRLWAEVPRPETSPEGVLAVALSDRGIGKDLAKAAPGATIRSGDEAVIRIGAMALLMDRRLPWTR